MKLSNKKIIVSTLALAMGAALAGSISGSVAWYQYSTRTSAQANGVSAGTSRQLYITSDDGENWSQHIALGTKNYRPVSYVTGGTFYEHPVYKTAAQTAVATNVKTVNAVETVAYAEYNLKFSCVDNTNGTTAAVAKDVYLSGLEILYTTSEGTKDITPAVRIKIDGTNDFVISKAAKTTETHGKLDLNNNSVNDKDGILVDDVAGNDITYYAGAADASYDSVAPASAMPTSTTDPYAFEGKDGKALTTTVAGANQAAGKSAAVNVKIWIEGWDALAAGQIWDAAYMQQTFTVNMQFACEADQ